ncbi:hypothetical protein ACFQ0B_46675 [Nonomuraea thailandensis]
MGQVGLVSGRADVLDRPLQPRLVELARQLVDRDVDGDPPPVGVLDVGVAGGQARGGVDVRGRRPGGGDLSQWGRTPEAPELPGLFDCNSTVAVTAETSSAAAIAAAGAPTATSTERAPAAARPAAPRIG